jgi:hypothetical protein
MTDETINMSEAIKGVTINVRLKGAAVAALRTRAGIALMGFAARIIGCDVAFNTESDEAIEVSEAGIPRALSTVERFRGYRRNAVGIAEGLLVMSNGEVQHDVVSFDIDANRVSRYDRTTSGHLMLASMGDDAVEQLVIKHVRGAVTVWRKHATAHGPCTVPDDVEILRFRPLRGGPEKTVLGRRATAQPAS